MKELSVIRRVGDEWVFDYASDTDPGNDLYRAGAIAAEDETEDVIAGARMKNAAYTGSAYADPNTESALKEVQARLQEWGWTLESDEETP
jgi:hypothetical protein